jgi:DNA-binding CsgD family transcriptional regulator
MAMPAKDAIRGEHDRHAQAGLDRHGYARAAVRVLRRAVPFDGVAVVWFDPATGLPVDKWIDHCGELREADLEEFRRLAASGRRAARLSRHGLGAELRAVYVGDSGMWGAIVMRRGRGAPDFTSRDADLLASLTGWCPAAQRARLERDLSADTGDRERGLLLLDEEDGIEMADAVAAAWLDELRDDGQRPPLVVRAVADRARAIASGHSDVAATARVPARSGRWILVRGSVLGNGAHARAAVTLEPARAPELAELIAEAYGLTARERRITELVAHGLRTAAIAAQLYLSTYTVQDHLKAIFEKLDVSSRGELVARLFVDHSVGRVRELPAP